MLDTLSDKLQGVLKNLKGEGRVSERHIEKAMREIRIALLEADVNFKVVKGFVAGVKEKALGQEVLKSLTPGQQVVKIVRDELMALFGDEAVPLQFAKTPPTVIMMVGLQGSGKTTSSGKLSLWLRKQGRRPMMVSTDVYRPAAIEQLAVVARELDVPVFESDDMDPVSRAEAAAREARNTGHDVLLIDTAGRLHIDEKLMDELERIRRSLGPKEILLVADAMTGQDAVKSAKQFDEWLDVSGVVLTKMDGDSRGGASLSINQVTGKPIKFIGVGEKYSALEVFHPERMAGRILGMGDVLSLIEKAEETVDEEQAERMLEKMRKDEFSLEDFRDQLRQLRKLGPLDELMGMLPNAGPLKGLDKVNLDEKQLSHTEAIINSMTPLERHNFKVINGSRRKRIAEGSGRPVSEVNRLLRQYADMRKMMKKMSKGMLGRIGKGALGKRLPKMNFPF
ncbi:MAG TPA: signal recognition particle protein [Acidobacteriota bacterium]|nr:signal recognition particle protein [Acidobacteriota bacterium]